MSEPCPDADAMRRLCEGEDLALNDLMARWQAPLIRYLCRYTGSEDDARDLAQETFVRVYEHRARYTPRGKFSTWLYTIATNLCRNLARWKTRHPTLPLDVPDGHSATVGDAVPADAASPDAAAVESERAAAVRDAVQSLPPDLRAAVVLSEYEDQSHAEIAGVLGCTQKAVETRLYRARQALRQRLARWLE